MDNYHSTVMGGYVNRTKIAQLYADAESLGGQTVTVAGWVKSVSLYFSAIVTRFDASETIIET